MPHIHEKYDFVVNCFIVHKDKVLLIHHKGLNKWLPIGGHIELDEDPEEALFREIEEECGLAKSDLILINKTVGPTSDRNKLLPIPSFFDVHSIDDTHHHIGLSYVAESNTDQVVLAEKEHHQIKWFSASELENLKEDILPEIREYALLSLDKVLDA